MVQAIGQQEQVRQGDAVVGGSVLRHVAQLAPLVPDRLGRLAPSGSLGQIGQGLGGPGQAGRPGKGLVERPLFLGEIGFAGEAAETPLALLVELPARAEQPIGIDDRMRGEEAHPLPRLARLVLEFPHVQQGRQPLAGLLGILRLAGHLPKPGRHGHFLTEVSQRRLGDAVDEVGALSCQRRRQVAADLAAIIGLNLDRRRDAQARAAERDGQDGNGQGREPPEHYPEQSRPAKESPHEELSSHPHHFIGPSPATARTPLYHGRAAKWGSRRLLSLPQPAAKGYRLGALRRHLGDRT